MLRLQRYGSFMETRINEWNMFWACSQKQTSPSCKTGNLQSAPLPRHSLVSVFTKNIKTPSLCFTMFSPWQGKRRHITRSMAKKCWLFLEKSPAPNSTRLTGAAGDAPDALTPPCASAHTRTLRSAASIAAPGAQAQISLKNWVRTPAAQLPMGAGRTGPRRAVGKCSRRPAPLPAARPVPAVGKEGKGRAAAGSPYLRAAPPGRRPSRPAPGPAAAAPPCPARPRATSPARGSARPPRTQGLSFH